jgi:hypothetical protein
MWGEKLGPNKIAFRSSAVVHAFFPPKSIVYLSLTANLTSCFAVSRCPDTTTFTFPCITASVAVAARMMLFSKIVICTLPQLISIPKMSASVSRPVAHNEAIAAAFTSSKSIALQSASKVKANGINSVSTSSTLLRGPPTFVQIVLALIHLHPSVLRHT